MRLDPAEITRGRDLRFSKVAWKPYTGPEDGRYWCQAKGCGVLLRDPRECLEHGDPAAGRRINAMVDRILGRRR